MSAVLEQDTSTKYKDVAQVAGSPVDLYQRGAQDFQFFAGLCIPHIIRFPFPPLYIAIWQLIVTATTKEERDNVIRYAIGLPRGFAKTTFLKILAVWLIVYDKVSFLLIVGATENLAHNFLSDVDDILASPNIEAIYGAWTINKAVDNREMKKAMYRRKVIILMGIGAGTAIRGINLAYERPDFLLCDDMQTKENADSETESSHLLDWFTGTLLKVVDPFFATVLYSGNMYPQNCILARLQENPYWVSLVTGCILADGHSLWEEVRPLKALHQDFKHDEALGRGHIWFAEMMNQPLLDRISLLPDGTIPPAPLTIEELLPEAGAIVIDPAGLKSTSDDNVITAAYTDELKRFAVVDLNCAQKTPKEVIQCAITMGTTLGIRVIAVEDVAYQSTLAFWFVEKLKELGMQDHFKIIGINPRKRQKESRIIASVKGLFDRQWFFLDDEARQRYVFQALSYKIGKKKNRDDILDACAYFEDLRNPEFWSILQAYPVAGPPISMGQVVGGNTPF